MNTLKEKNVLVVGLGKSGIAAVQALLKLQAKVAVQDSLPEEKIEAQLVHFLRNKNVTCYFGSVPENLEKYDMLVLSPGVPPELPFIKEAQSKGVEVIGELEIAYRVGRGQYVSITGTNGKTTTTTLVGEIFRNAKRKTYVVGNIGVAVISRALTAEDDAWLITETSSFQLETTKHFKPAISALLNLTPDHMDRHKTFENYGQSKAKIFQNQGADGYFIVNYDDKAAYALSASCKAKVVPFSRKEKLAFGAFVENGGIVINDGQGKTVRFCSAAELIIPGAHNLENALAATAIAYFAGIEPEVITETLRTFEGVEHRLEFCGVVDGVRFINDSKGTNPDASIKAIEAIDSDIILIAGGYDKDSNFEELIGAFDGKVKHVMLLGKTAHIIKDTAEQMGFRNTVILKDMEECVRHAFHVAKAGDTVLLSPACASWDMYTCFEQRGEHFKNCVHRLGI